MSLIEQESRSPSAIFLMASALLPAVPQGSLRNSRITVAIRAIMSVPSSKARLPVTLQV